jgi:hypothetical protein
MTLNLIGPIIPDRITPTTTSTAEQLSDLQFRLKQTDNILTGLIKARNSYALSLKSAKASGNITAIVRLTDLISDLNSQIDENTKIGAKTSQSRSNLSKANVKDQGGAVATQKASTTTTPVKTSTTTSASSSTGGTNISSVAEGTTANTTTVTPASVDSSSPVDYNLPAPKDAYFQNMKLMYDGRVGLITPGGAKVDDSSTYLNNTPARVTDALDLWVTTQASKGMIQTYIPKNNYFKDIFAGVDAQSVSDFQAAGELSGLNKFGFQFQYNPNSVSMPISGTAAVDYMKYVAGPPDVIPLGDSGASITFDILLNRMFDMPFLDSNGRLKPNLTLNKVYGVPASGFDNDLKAIYEKGTMYDLEYLMKTIIGFELNTIFRGKSADVGFLLGRLVELHLGKSLRYLVTINSVNIEHVHFDARMVPLISYVKITASRIPDFAPKVSEG